MTPVWDEFNPAYTVSSNIIAHLKMILAASVVL
jgi:hypothetical protein